MVKTIRNVSDLRVVMHRNERPIYFISATNFNLHRHRSVGAQLPVHQLHRLLSTAGTRR